MKLERWAHGDGFYMGTGDTETVDTLVPGVYDLAATPQGQTLFVPVSARDDELLRFPDTAIGAVLEEIETFWEREDLFRKYDLPFKRGILLYGPPGSGKSSTLQLIARDVVDRGGIVLLFGNPILFLSGYRIFRAIQPDTPLVVLMEDLDAILEKNKESSILNLLDGIEGVDKVVFLATTNYPELLGPRIINRPSRFDRRYMVPHPGEESRRVYLRALAKNGGDFDVDKWARDTKGLSLAHIKELFVSVFILGGGFGESLKILKGMNEKVGSWQDNEGFAPKLGFGGSHL